MCTLCDTSRDCVLLTRCTQKVHSWHGKRELPRKVHYFMWCLQKHATCLIVGIARISGDSNYVATIKMEGKKTPVGLVLQIAAYKSNYWYQSVPLCRDFYVDNAYVPKICALITVHSLSASATWTEILSLQKRIPKVIHRQQLMSPKNLSYL